jgi:hypothetical protein
MAESPKNAVAKTLTSRGITSVTFSLRAWSKASEKDRPAGADNGGFQWICYA